MGATISQCVHERMCVCAKESRDYKLLNGIILKKNALSDQKRDRLIAYSNMCANTYTHTCENVLKSLKLGVCKIANMVSIWYQVNTGPVSPIPKPIHILIPKKISNSGKLPCFQTGCSWLRKKGSGKKIHLAIQVYRHFILLSSTTAKFYSIL